MQAGRPALSRDEKGATMPPLSGSLAATDTAGGREFSGSPLAFAVSRPKE